VILLGAINISIVAQDSFVQKRMGKVDSAYQYQGKVQSLANTFNHKQDSVSPASTHKADSTLKFKTHKVDSIHKQFAHRTDSLQKAYAAPLNKIQSSINKLNHKKDSLSKLHLATLSVTHKIDSLQKAQTAKLKELNGKIDKVKNETLTKVSSLHLPPEAQKEIDDLAKNIHSFKVPNNFFQLPGMNFIPKTTAIPGLSNFSLSLPSNLSIPTVKIPSLQKFNLNVKQLPSLSQLEGSLGKELKQLQSAASMKSIEQTAMKELSQNAEVKSLLKEETQVKDMASQLSKMKDPKSAEAMAQQQLQPAVNHFAGKEKELQSAMGEISKYKQKYSSVKSLAELPKRAPNPLKEKPWIERVVPGLNYFILSKHSTFVDFNPYIGWRFNPRLTASIGWSERVGISHGNVSTSPYDRVYGIRANVSYLWTHGFIFRLSPELMSAYVPTSSTPDTKEQALVLGLFGGVRKDFKIYKGIIGYTEGMYNFIQKPGQNLYGDRLSLRLGIEVKIKKQAKKNNPGMVNPSSIRRKTVALKDSFNIIGKEKLFAVVNIKGDTVVPLKYQRIKKFFNDGNLYFIVKKDKRFGALSTSGKEVIPISHLEATTVKLEIIDRLRKKLIIKEAK